MISLGGVLLSSDQAEAHGNVADEQPPRRWVQLDRLAQQLGQDLRHGGEWNVAAAILLGEVFRQLEVFAEDLRLVLAFVKLRFDGVAAGRGEAQLVFLAVDLAFDRSQRLQQFDQTDVRMALNVEHGRRVGGLRRVHREFLRLRMDRRPVRNQEQHHHRRREDCTQPQTQAVIGQPELQSHPHDPRTIQRFP